MSVFYCQLVFSRFSVLLTGSLSLLLLLVVEEGATDNCIFIAVLTFLQSPYDYCLPVYFWILLIYLFIIRIMYTVTSP